MSDESHWQEVYSRKRSEGVSWFRPHLEQSLAFIRASELEPDARIVDVGGGASTLVDDLWAEGFHNLAVVDLAQSALDVARARMGAVGGEIDWIRGDATMPLLESNSIDFWHDRAVFHFLTDPAVRSAYREQVSRSVRPGGYVLISTFALDGPEKCSGLEVARYDAAGIHAVLGDTFHKIGQASELHETPWGSSQSFVYCFCRREVAG